MSVMFPSFRVRVIFLVLLLVLLALQFFPHVFMDPVLIDPQP